MQDSAIFLNAGKKALSFTMLMAMPMLRQLRGVLPILSAT
jgi:hypothetical protein